MHWSVRFICHSGQSRGRVWDFEGKAGNLQAVEEQTGDKHILAGPPRHRGTQREAQQTGSAGSPCLPHSVYIKVLR